MGYRTTQVLHSIKGTPLYMAPELVQARTRRFGLRGAFAMGRSFRGGFHAVQRVCGGAAVVLTQSPSGIHWDRSVYSRPRSVAYQPEYSEYHGLPSSPLSRLPPSFLAWWSAETGGRYGPPTNLMITDHGLRLASSY